MHNNFRFKFPFLSYKRLLKDAYYMQTREREHASEFVEAIFPH